MRLKARKGTRYILMGIAVIPVIVLAFFASTINRQPFGTMDFYGTSKEVSLDEFIDSANKMDLSLHLLTELPNNLKRTAIYLKESPFIAIIVYSAKNNKDYETAELTVEIVATSDVPTFEELEEQAKESPYESILEINGWPVQINERAYSGGSTEFRDKYGDYTLLVTTWIDGNRYGINAPTLATNDVVQLVESMKLITS